MCLRVSGVLWIIHYALSFSKASIFWEMTNLQNYIFGKNYFPLHPWRFLGPQHSFFLTSIFPSLESKPHCPLILCQSSLLLPGLARFSACALLSKSVTEWNAHALYLIPKSIPHMLFEVNLPDSFGNCCIFLYT